MFRLLSSVATTRSRLGMMRMAPTFSTKKARLAGVPSLFPARQRSTYAASTKGTPMASSERIPDVTWANLKLQLLRRSEEHTSELQSRGHLVCRLLLEKKK